MKTKPGAGIGLATIGSRIFRIVKMGWNAILRRKETRSPEAQIGAKGLEQQECPPETPESEPKKHDHRLRLTGLGKEIAEAISAKAWAERLAPDLREQTRGKQPYQINQIARDTAAMAVDEETTRRVAEAAYQFGIEKEEVKWVLRIVLRDLLLEQAEAGATHAERKSDEIE